jgi:hypothetical protein
MALKISSNLPSCYIAVYTNLTQVKRQVDLETVKETVRSHYKAFIKNRAPEELAFINYTSHQDRKKYQRRGNGSNKQKKISEGKDRGGLTIARDIHITLTSVSVKTQNVSTVARQDT